MARLYADEQFPFEVVEHLCRLGHDVLTVQTAGNANLKIIDLPWQQESMLLLGRKHCCQVN
jgi:Domain of unknown function (DUF5615)